MKDFFREYWLWIVIPFLIVIGGILMLFLMSDGNSVSQFQYNVLGG